MHSFCFVRSCFFPPSSFSSLVLQFFFLFTPAPRLFFSPFFHHFFTFFWFFLHFSSVPSLFSTRFSFPVFPLALSSRHKLAEKVKSQQPFDARDVIQAADDGDELAQRIWAETCRYLALGCVNIEHLFNPQLIVLAGGMINAGKRLLDPVRAHFTSQRWQITSDRPEIVPATLGNDAGIIGAATLARQGG